MSSRSAGGHFASSVVGPGCRWSVIPWRYRIRLSLPSVASLFLATVVSLIARLSLLLVAGLCRCYRLVSSVVVLCRCPLSFVSTISSGFGFCRRTLLRTLTLRLTASIAAPCRCAVEPQTLHFPVAVAVPWQCAALSLACSAAAWSALQRLGLLCHCLVCAELLWLLCCCLVCSVLPGLLRSGCLVSAELLWLVCCCFVCAELLSLCCCCLGCPGLLGLPLCCLIRAELLGRFCCCLGYPAAACSAAAWSVM